MRLILNVFKIVFSGITHGINWLFDDSGRGGKTRVTQDKYRDKVNTSRMKRDGRYAGKWDRWTG